MNSPTDRMSVLNAWWRLANIKGLGIVSQNQLFDQFIQSSESLSPDQLPDFIAAKNHDTLTSLGFKDKVISALESDDESLNYGWQFVLDWEQADGCGVLFKTDPQYPESLAALRDSPLFLFYAGDLNILSAANMAIVGSRNPSHYGREQAQSLAQQLVMSDWNVVSGLALGIDACAHQGGLCDSTGLGKGHTIAVLGSGLNNIYPKRHAELATDIVKHGGLLLSEYLPDAPAVAQNFPRRNRIVSGLSRGVIVIEAALKSGSLITAKLAAEQGREVFALPGPINNPLSRGCHQLIKDGAYLIEGIDDVADVFAEDFSAAELAATEQSSKNDGSKETSESLVQSNYSTEEQRLFEALDSVPVGLDVLVSRTGLEVAYLSQQLVFWELKGKVSQVPGGYIRQL